jgi:RNA polymerase-associated protein
MIHRIQKDWCGLVDRILEQPTGKGADAARKELKESLLATAPLFGEMPYFLSEEFTIVDCCIVPILWRLPALGIELDDKQAKPLVKYMERMFERESFKASLSDLEEDIRS